MSLRISCPNFGSQTAEVRVARFYAAVGDALQPGDKIVDLVVDLSGGVTRDCPPISTCRITMREPGLLQALCVKIGDHIAQGQPIALISSEAHIPSAEVVREARVAVAAMLHHEDWWTSQG